MRWSCAVHSGVDMGLRVRARGLIGLAEAVRR